MNPVIINTGGPRYIQEIGTKKSGVHIMNSQIKRPRIPINYGMGSLKTANFQSHISQFKDKKIACNEIHLYNILGLDRS